MNATANEVRPAVMAGRFYPAQRSELEGLVERFLSEARTEAASGDSKALIAPHAGYSFSGPVAGSAFRNWSASSRTIRRVVLLGPAHFVSFQGLALPPVAAFATPFGAVRIDDEAVERLHRLKQVHEFSPAHEREHCLEVELPFLQLTLTDFSIVPLVIGEASDEEIGEVVELLWGGDETRFVISSDLSHFLDYDSARQRDEVTASAIELARSDAISEDGACGHRAIRGFLKTAVTRQLQARTLDLRSSGDTAGSRERVVGYGAFAFAEQPSIPVLK